MPIERPGPAFTGVSEVLSVDKRGDALNIEVLSWALSQDRAEMHAERAANRSPGPGILGLLGSQAFQAIESEELDLERRLVIKGYRVEVANQEYRRRIL